MFTEKEDSRAGQERFYRGIKMRSRAEARAASFFDYHNVAWKYEPERIGSVGYLPDFYLPEHKTYVEIKPAGISISELAKFYLAAEQLEPRQNFVLLYVTSHWRPIIWDLFFEKKPSNWVWNSSVEMEHQYPQWLPASHIPALKWLEDLKDAIDMPGRCAVLFWYWKDKKSDTH